MFGAAALSWRSRRGIWSHSRTPSEASQATSGGGSVPMTRTSARRSGWASEQGRAGFPGRSARPREASRSPAWKRRTRPRSSAWVSGLSAAGCRTSTRTPGPSWMVSPALPGIGVTAGQRGHVGQRFFQRRLGAKDGDDELARLEIAHDGFRAAVVGAAHLREDETVEPVDAVDIGGGATWWRAWDFRGRC